jgi:parallel beta-helix repeat protein
MTFRPPHPPARFLPATLLLSAFLLCALLLSSPAAAAGSTLYVDRGNSACSDTGPGSQTTPFCTITAAASKSQPGDTVQVAAGTYPENVSITKSGTAAAPIVFTPAPGATVTVSGGTGIGINLSTVSWVVVRGFTVTQTPDYGINASNSSNITISGNHVSFAGQPVSGENRTGIRLNNTSDSLVSGNTSDHNSDYGIMLTSGSTRDEVRGNLTFSNSRVFSRATAGIRLYQSPGNTVDGNVSHDNQDSGIECYPGSNNTLVYNNVVYNNGDHGIDDLTTTGQRIISNTAYHNVTAGINVEGGSTGATVENNISVDNGIKSPRTHSDIRVEHGSTAGTTMDYDLVYLTVPDTVLIWDSVSYSSLAAFQAATGQESHGIFADPRFVDPGNGDFRLRPGSPAIDSADSSVSGQPSTDVLGTPRIDDPATPNTGVGPRTYDDRGAYEFQPGQAPAPPNAAVNVAPSSGAAPLQVVADASSSTAGGAPISTYTFDFGDGSTAVGPQSSATASHTYSSPGDYTVTVTVTDTAGLASTATAHVTATSADSPPNAALSVSPSSGSAPLQVSADASASTDTDSTPISTYSFDFGDGSAAVGPQAGATASHTYTSAGTYTVTVTVTDTGGLSSTATKQVTVQSGGPVNLVGNPGFENGLSGWNTSGSDPGVTITQVAGGHSGSFAARLANPSSTAATYTLNDSPNWANSTVAGTYTGSLWVRSDTPGASLKLRFREYVGSTLAGTATSTVTLTSSWQQVTVTYSPVSPGSSTLDFNAYVSKGAAGTSFDADDASITRN